MNNNMYIIWGFLGLIGWVFTYNTLRKYWYIKLHKDIWKTDQKIILILLYICFPIWIIGGLWSIIYWAMCYNKKYWSLYFNIKRYEKY